MANIGSRKQITFDLCQEALKKYYPHSLTQAYYDIRRFMESHGFEHRQSSAYVSLDKMTTLDVVSLAEQLAMALPWLSRCVNEIDVANIGVQHSLKKVLENASRPLSVELEALPLEAGRPAAPHPRAGLGPSPESWRGAGAPAPTAPCVGGRSAANTLRASSCRKAAFCNGAVTRLEHRTVCVPFPLA